MKKRIDILIREKGLVKSRSVAQRLINKGLVKIGNRVIEKPSQEVDIDSDIELESLPKYVGRGGKKLEGALEDFGIDVEGIDALDIGSSTGGFTDCLLQNGADHIYAVDVGKNQIDQSLK